MPAKQPAPAAPEITAEERRARKVALFQARHAARTNYDLSNHPPCGPLYELANVPEAAIAEVTHVRQA